MKPVGVSLCWWIRRILNEETDANLNAARFLSLEMILKEFER
jgi:hypothetical protein